uniref:Uncharacterized protein n=1 Tax=Aegilops tauschii subsp. strangulata TaxID=200361 RepID=A0A453NUQ9_AEGTS
MVSLRRRRLLGLCSGKDSLPVDLPKPVENEKHGEVEHANVNPLSVHPLPLTRTSDVLPESSNGSDSLKEEKNQYYPGLYFFLHSILGISCNRIQCIIFVVTLYGGDVF